MDRQVLKGMVLMLKQVLSELEAEVYSDKEAYAKAAEINADRFDMYGSSQAEDAYSTVAGRTRPQQDYELYDDDDGYSDQRANSKTAFKEFWQYSYKSFDL